MSISIRQSIRWLPDRASEPTHTIVLTSPARRFVDIRILKDRDPAQPSLEWAFAGVSSSEDRNGVMHSVWRHLVDSRTQTPEAVVDEGDIFPQEHGRTLETGRMVNPMTGKLTDYEEVWSDLEAEDMPRTSRDSAEPTTTQQQLRRRCVVLELRDQERGARGMAVCLGAYYQAVVRVGDQFAAERWKWGKGRWQFEYKTGPGWTPEPEHISNHESLSLGEELPSQDATQRWTVVEISFS